MLAKQHAERFPVRNFTVRVKTYSKYKQSTVHFFLGMTTLWLGLFLINKLQKNKK